MKIFKFLFFRYWHSRMIIVFIFFILMISIISLISENKIIGSTWEGYYTPRISIIFGVVTTFIASLYECIRYMKKNSKIDVTINYYNLNKLDELSNENEYLKLIEKEENIEINNDLLVPNNYEDLYELLDDWNKYISKKEAGYIIKISIKNDDKTYIYLIKTKHIYKLLYPKETMTILAREKNSKFKITKIKKGAQSEVFYGYK